MSRNFSTKLSEVLGGMADIEDPIVLLRSKAFGGVCSLITDFKGFEHNSPCLGAFKFYCVSQLRLCLDFGGFRF